MSNPMFEMIDPSGSRLTVTATRREFPNLTDYWDGNWFYATITVAAGAFRGEYESMLRSEEFSGFRKRLASLHESLSGHAQFKTMETWLSLDIEGDGKGHFRAECVAVDRPGTGNRLSFAIEFDQTEIPKMLRGLDAIIEAFPVVGAP